ncbi:MAG: hypothetical protein ACOC5K_04845 [Chloroflexota bacterium]
MKGIGVSLAMASLLLAPGDQPLFSPARLVSMQHAYRLVSWEFGNFPDKWLRIAWGWMPWAGSTEEEKRAALERYLELNEEIRAAASRLDRVAADASATEGEVADVQNEVDRLQKERNRLRLQVEEYLESVLDSVIRDLGLGLYGPLTWPPVDFRMDETPRVLVVSPRDDIYRRSTVLIQPETSVQDMERMERRLLEDHDLSGVVLKTGGVATYPTVIPADRSLRDILDVAAHEWLHVYLFFHPLGQAFWDGGEMTTLNETLANLFEREVGRLAYQRITGEELPPPGPLVPPEEPGGGDGEPGEFDFREFMRETRVRAEQLLAEGEVGEAESYMERRRVELQDHGFFIRKINQAYFAFFGSYADSAGSTSPIARQLDEVRSHYSDVGEVVRALQDVGSYDEFQAILERLGASGPNPEAVASPLAR